MLKGIFMNKLGKLKGIRKCKNCGVDVEIYHKDRLQRINIFCSKKCEGQYIKSKTKVKIVKKTNNNWYPLKNKSGELLETLEIGNQQPSYLGINRRFND